jgi:hypothetical protein
MTRLAADSITAADIPTGRFPIVCGYVDGIYAWSEQDWLRHTNSGAIAVGIAVLPTTDAGQVCDVESGDLTPDQAVRWVGMRRASGLSTPTVYCSISAWPYVAAAFINAGVAQPTWWLAGYDDVPAIPAGAVAKQYANEPLSGGHYDLSIVADFWPGVDSQTSGGFLMALSDTEQIELRDKIRQLWQDMVNGPSGDYNMGVTLKETRDKVNQLWQDICNGPAGDYNLGATVTAIKAELDASTSALAAVKSELDALKASSGGDPATLAVVSRIEKAMQAA